MLRDRGWVQLDVSPRPPTSYAGVELVPTSRHKLLLVPQVGERGHDHWSLSRPRAART